MQERETQLRAQVAAMEQRISHLEQVIETGKLLNTTLNLRPLLETITQVVTEQTETEGCSILLLDQKTGKLRFRAAAGPKSEGVGKFSIPSSEGIAGHVLLENKPILVQDAQNDARFFVGVDKELSLETRSLIGVPLQVKGKAIGVLEAVNKKGGQEMNWADVEVLTVLANQAAVAIENARLYDDIRRIKEFNEDLVQNVTEAIVITDARRTITFANPAAAILLGYTPKELMGQPWTFITPPDQQSTVEAVVPQRLRGEASRYELELVHKDGRRVPVLVSANPRFDAATRRFVGTMAVFTDITQVLAHQKVEQELALAWQMQSSFLPDTLPDIPGWQLAATLEPARRTSGDFYDLIPLPNGRFGLLIADVADKGMGAALYMAVSRTLIRTYAVEYHTQPRFVFNAANRRMMSDTHGDLFVTAFYGVLDPASGTLTYCNAGHNPPFLLRRGDATVQALTRTGMPLGAFKGMTWEQQTLQLAPGDVLLLYTDGVTDAEDEGEAFFGQERLIEVARANLGCSAQDMQDATMAAIHEFMGGAPQFDDITLMLVVRGAPAK